MQNKCINKINTAISLLPYVQVVRWGQASQWFRAPYPRPLRLRGPDDKMSWPPHRVTPERIQKRQYWYPGLMQYKRATLYLSNSSARPKIKTGRQQREKKIRKRRRRKRKKEKTKPNVKEFLSEGVI